MKKKTWLLLLFALNALLALLTGCQSIPIKKKIDFPMGLTSKFANCLTGDGALLVTLIDQKKRPYEVNMDWIVKRRNLMFEFYNPFGRTLLSVGYDDRMNQLKARGVLAKRLPKIETDRKGFFEIDGRFVPIQARELGCLFNFMWPYDWITNISEYHHKKNEYILIISEKDKEIELKMDGKDKILRSCARIKWDVFWPFVSSDLVVCMRYDKPETLSLRRAGQEIIKWENQED